MLSYCQNLILTDALYGPCPPSDMLSSCPSCFLFFHLPSFWSTAQLKLRIARRSWPISKISMPRRLLTFCHLWSLETPWDAVWLALRPTVPKPLSSSMNFALYSSSMRPRRGLLSPKLSLGLAHQQVLSSLPLLRLKVKTRLKLGWMTREAVLTSQQRI